MSEAHPSQAQSRIQTMLLLVNAILLCLILSHLLRGTTLSQTAEVAFGWMFFGIAAVGTGLGLVLMWRWEV